MLYYYLVIAFRQFKKQGGFLLINILGLAIGVAACLHITGYVRFHRSFDKQTPHWERTYRVQYSRWLENGDLVAFASSSPTIGPAMMERVPAVVSFARMYHVDGVFFHGEDFFEESRAYWGESALFDLLGIDVLAGDGATCLDLPGTAALSASTARKYFGDEDPLGKVITRNRDQLYRVTAVYEDLEPNRHLEADLFLSMATWMQEVPDLFTGGWFNSGFYTYVRLLPGTDPGAVDRAVAEYIDREFGETLSAYQMGMSFRLQPLSDIHLGSHYMHELKANGKKETVDMLAIIAWFILLIAWVNFFNLGSIASLRRLREVGLRRVGGASSRQLTMQFLVESAIVNAMALVLALGLYEVSLPLFRTVAGLPAGALAAEWSWFPAVLGAAFLFGTLSAGAYQPASLSTAKLVHILKGTLAGTGGKAGPRRVLVGFQFFIAMALLAGTLGVYLQYRHISRQAFGFKIENMLVCKAPAVGDNTLVSRFRVFCNEAENLPGVKGACFSSVVPGKPNIFNRGGIYRFGGTINDGKNFRVTEADSRFFDTYEIGFLAGEGFTGNEAIDAGRVVLNGYGAIWLGFESPEAAVGQRLVLEGNDFLISGVVADFHQLSPGEAIEPQLFRWPQRHGGYLSVSLEAPPTPGQLAQLENLFTSVFPDNPFEPFFLEPLYEAQFAQEKRFGKVFGLFSLLALAVTVFGLIGMAASAAEQRKKEVGIRKVLGAGHAAIFFSLFRDYLVLCALAALVALPPSWYLLQRWMSGYALRAPMPWWLFVLPVMAVAGVSLLTVWWQSQRIIRLNPVENLKYE
jgi:putative ABC transport system permease protein